MSNDVIEPLQPSIRSSPCLSLLLLLLLFEGLVQKKKLTTNPYSLYSEIEFWSGKPSRLHDRIRYLRVEGSSSDDPTWKIERLAP